MEHHIFAPHRGEHTDFLLKCVFLQRAVVRVWAAGPQSSCAVRLQSLSGRGRWFVLWSRHAAVLLFPCVCIVRAGAGGGNVDSSKDGSSLRGWRTSAQEKKQEKTTA